MMINNNQIQIATGIFVSDSMAVTKWSNLKHFARIRHENRKKKFFLPHWSWDGDKIYKMRWRDYANWIIQLFVIKKIK